MEGHSSSVEVVGVEPEKRSGDLRQPFPSPAAYRVGAAMLLLNVANAAPALFRGTISIGAFGAVIDFILAILLLFRSEGARTFVLIRATLGLILGPLLQFLFHDGFVATIMAMIQASYCGVLLILLTGRSQWWRFVAAVAGVLAYLVLQVVVGIVHYYEV